MLTFLGLPGDFLSFNFFVFPTLGDFNVVFNGDLTGDLGILAGDILPDDLLGDLEYKVINCI